MTPLLPTPLEVLYEADGLPVFDLPDELLQAYGGTFGLERPRIYANFVSTVDGVIAIRSLPRSNKLIAAGSAADRFVMGVLRACADAVVIGSGTLEGSPGSVWTPGQVYPAARESFTEARRRLGGDGEPEVVILSGRGTVDPGHPVLVAGALVLTSDAGAEALAPRLPEASTVISLGPDPRLDLRAAMALVAGRGHRLILSEGGPHVLGKLLEAGLVDELFLTVSPLLVGRTEEDTRLALVEHADLLQNGPAAARLLGIRRDGDHLFLRYALAR